MLKKLNEIKPNANFKLEKMKSLYLSVVLLLWSTSIVLGQYNTWHGSGNHNRGSYNSQFGYRAGYSLTSSAHYNVMLGSSSPFRRTSTGDANVFVGHNSGLRNTSGGSNVYLGMSAGYSNIGGSGNVFIGRSAGYSETGSNKLYIDNSSITTPLIFGDFSSNQVGINVRPGSGYTLHVGGNLRTNGSLTLNGGGYIDDDTSFGGNADDWIRLNGYIELKSNTDNYGIVLRNRDANDYLALTQVDGSSYLTESSTYGSYFIKGTNRDTHFGNHVYGKTVNAAYSNLYRFGGLFLTWDSDTYGTHTHHSIRSTYGDAYGDDITINSYDHLRFNLDANNNNPNSYFEVGQHTTGTGNILMRLVSPSGNLGLGVTDPQEKLHVNGNIRGNQSGGAVRIKTDHGNIDIGPQNQYWAHIYTDMNRFLFNKDVYSIEGFSSYSNSDLVLKTNGTERLRILHAGGNVGIGTTTPAYKLDVSGPVNATEFRVNGNLLTIPPQYWNQTGTSIDYSAGNVGIGTAIPAHALDVNGAINATEIRLNGEIFNPTVWNQSGTDINYTGGVVSIGTAAVPAGYRLAVDGNIIAEEVQVLLSDIWPDYVFEEDYKLRSLEEVEHFVKANKHLPEVPSAREVAEGGQGLGKMNTILLRKVEELTLYLIEQQKTIQAQETRIEELYRRLEQKNN